MTTNRQGGVLYTGVTSNLVQRAWQHRTGAIAGFTKRYNLSQLVFFESHEQIDRAIQREHTIKHWPRAWKVALIEALNPAWHDLYDTIL